MLSELFWRTHQCTYRGVMCRDYTCVWYRDFPKYCVQDTEKIWTHEEEDSPSCIAAIQWTQGSIYGSVLFIEKRHVSVDNRCIRCTVLTFGFCAIFASGRFVAILWWTVRRRGSFGCAVFLPGSAGVSGSGVRSSHLCALCAGFRGVRVAEFSGGTAVDCNDLCECEWAPTLASVTVSEPHRGHHTP